MPRISRCCHSVYTAKIVNSAQDYFVDYFSCLFIIHKPNVRQSEMIFSRSMYFMELAMFLIVSLLRHHNSSVEIPIDVNKDTLEAMLQKAKQLRGQEYAVWQIKGGLPVQLQEHEFNEEHSAPRIILQKLRDHEKEWNLCYWIPRHERGGHVCAAETNDFVSATYTMALDQILNENSHYHYQRQSKGHPFNRSGGSLESCLDGAHRYHFTELTKQKQFVLLEEQSYVLIRQGYPMAWTLGSDNCAVMYINNVFVFCGNMGISIRLKSIAHQLGRILQEEVQKFNPNATYIEIDYGNLGTSQQKIDDVVEFFRNAYLDATLSQLPKLKSYANLYKSLIETYWGNQRLLSFTKDIDDEVWFTSLHKGPLNKSMLKSNECQLVYFTETLSEGFYLWIGKNSSIEDRMRASIKLEQAINLYYSSHWGNKSSVGIIPKIITEGREPLEFKTIFMDWFDEDNLNFGYGVRDAFK